MKEQFQIVEGKKKPEIDCYVIHDNLAPIKDEYKFYTFQGKEITDKVIDGELLLGFDNEGDYHMQKEPCRFSSNKKERELGLWLHNARCNGTCTSAQITAIERGYPNLFGGQKNECN